MKKSVILISTFCFITSLSADCNKTQISELQYMSKNELIAKYKLDNFRYKSSDDAAKNLTNEANEAEKKGDINVAISKLKTYKFFSAETSCFYDEVQNTGRILKKDFNMTDKDLEKLR